MDEKNNGDPQPNEGGDNTPDLNEEVTIGDDEVSNLDEETRKKITTLNAQKKHFRDKAIDSETGKPYKELYESVRQPEKPKESKPEKAENQIPDDLNQWREKVDFLQSNPNQAQHFEFIQTVARKNNTSLQEAAQSQEVKEFVEFREQKTKEEQASPESSSSQEQVNPREVQNLSDEEFRKMEEDSLKQQRSQQNV